MKAFNISRFSGVKLATTRALYSFLGYQSLRTFESLSQHRKFTTRCRQDVCLSYSFRGRSSSATLSGGSLLSRKSDAADTPGGNKFSSQVMRHVAATSWSHAHNLGLELGGLVRCVCVCVWPEFCVCWNFVGSPSCRNSVPPPPPPQWFIAFHPPSMRRLELWLVVFMKEGKKIQFYLIKCTAWQTAHGTACLTAVHWSYSGTKLWLG